MKKLVKKLVLVFVITSNSLLAQKIPDFKQDIQKAFDSLRIANELEPLKSHADLDAAAEYLVKIHKKSDFSYEAISDSFNINVFRYYVFGIQYWTPELWAIQLNNIIKNHGSVLTGGKYPNTYTNISIYSYGEFGNYAAIVIYGTKDAICHLPQRD